MVISERAGSCCLVATNNGETVDPYDVESVTKAFDNQLILVDHKDGIHERPSLMGVTFEERVSNLDRKLSFKENVVM